MQNAVSQKVVPLVPRALGIMSHHEIHDDELMGRWLLRTFGGDLFPGIATVPLYLVDSGLRRHRGKTGSDWFAAGYLCLGTCGGPLDEHDLPPEKRIHASAATLTAQMLKIDSYEPIRMMLEHTVRVDRTPTASAFDISAIVKACNRNGVPIDKLCRLYDRLADAWFAVLSGRVRNPQWHRRPTFDQLAAEWVVSRLAPKGSDSSTKKFSTVFDAAEELKLVGGRTLRPILGYAIQDADNLIQGVTTTNRIFELAGTVEALGQDGAAESDIREFVFTALDAKLQEQLRFMEGYDHLVALKKAGTLYVTGCPWRIIRITSDNSEINRAVRKLDPFHDVFIQRSTDGHLVAWYNKDKFNMDNVIGRLRQGDLRASNQPQRLSWKRLTSDGTISEAPWWYYNAANGQIMNGSRTNRLKPRTLLDDNEVIMAFVGGMKKI